MQTLVVCRVALCASLSNETEVPSNWVHLWVFYLALQIAVSESGPNGLYIPSQLGVSRSRPGPPGGSWKGTRSMADLGLSPVTLAAPPSSDGRCF